MVGVGSDPMSPYASPLTDALQDMNDSNCVESTELADSDPTNRVDPFSAELELIWTSLKLRLVGLAERDI